MRKITMNFLCAFAIFSCSSLAQAATIRVPQNYSTIQAAINAAQSSDTVLVSSGTYTGQVTMKAGVTLKSESGPASTILDGQGQDILVAHYADNADNFRLEGFTLVNGRSGVNVEYADNLVIAGNIIRNNSEYGIQVTNSSGLAVINNTVRDNTLTGIRNFAVSGKISNNIICQNSNGGIWLDNFGSTIAPQVVNNVIYANSYNNGVASEGGGLYITNVSPVVRNNIIFNNYGQMAGGVRGYIASGMTLEYNDVWNNTAKNVQGGDPNYYQVPSPVNSISSDPLFKDLASGDLHLTLDSPCVNAGNPDSAFNDTNGTRNDMGYYGGPDAVVESRTAYFVQRNGSQLVCNGQPFYFNGTNNDHPYHWSHYMISDAFNDAKGLGLTVFRVWASSEGQNSWKDGFNFQPNPGEYNEPTFQQLDYIIAKAEETGIRVILPLVNNWDDGYGGMQQYVRWSQGDPADWSQKSILTFDLYNAGDPVSCDLAVRTGDNWTWYESPLTTLSPGWNHITIDLAGSTWKTAATNWQYTASLADRNKIKSFAVGVFNYTHPGSFYIDNFRLDGVLYDGIEYNGGWYVADYSHASWAEISNAFVSQGSYGLRVDYSYSYGEDNKAFVEKQPQVDKNIFFTDPSCKQMYKNYINYILHRVNTYTGKMYRDDPAILMWELANEPRCESDPTGDTMRAWVDEMAAYVKGIDPNHLVSTGEEGWYKRAGSTAWQYDGRLGTDFIRNSQSSYIDMCSFHLYPVGYSLSDSDAMNWIQEHVDNALRIVGKPAYLGEFGYPADRRARILNNFDTGTEGWSIEWNFAGGPVQVESPSYDGNGSIRYEAVLSEGISSNGARIVYSTPQDYSNCDYISAYVYLPEGAPWDISAEMYAHSGDNWTWVSGRNYPLKPGAWTQIMLQRSWIENGGGDPHKMRSLGLQIKRGNTNYTGAVYYDLFALNMSYTTLDASAQMAKRNLTYQTWYSLLDAVSANGALFWEIFAHKDDGTLFPDYWNWAVYYPEDTETSGIIQNFSRVMNNKCLGGMYDTTPPSTPVVSDGGATTFSLTELFASWQAFDLESGIAGYQYIITRDCPGGVIIRDWTSTGTASSVTAGSLNLEAGKIYFFGIKARNGAGMESFTGYSDGILVDSGASLTLNSPLAAAAAFSTAAVATSAPDTKKPTVSGISDSPDPFDPEAGKVSVISFTVKDDISTVVEVVLNIYDPRGNIVRTYSNSVQPVGKGSFSWDGRNSSGAYVANAQYKYRLKVIDRSGNYVYSGYYYITKK